MNDDLKKYVVRNDGTDDPEVINDNHKKYTVTNFIPDHPDIVAANWVPIGTVKQDKTIENLYKEIYDKLVEINPEEAEKYETYLKIYNGDYRTTVLLIEINALEVKSLDVLKILKK